MNEIHSLNSCIFLQEYWNEIDFYKEFFVFLNQTFSSSNSFMNLFCLLRHQVDYFFKKYCCMATRDNSELT